MFRHNVCFLLRCVLFPVYIRFGTWFQGLRSAYSCGFLQGSPSFEGRASRRLRRLPLQVCDFTLGRVKLQHIVAHHTVLCKGLGAILRLDVNLLVHLISNDYACPSS